MSHDDPPPNLKLSVGYVLELYLLEPTVYLSLALKNNVIEEKTKNNWKAIIRVLTFHFHSIILKLN